MTDGLSKVSEPRTASFGSLLRKQPHGLLAHSTDFWWSLAASLEFAWHEEPRIAIESPLLEKKGSPSGLKFRSDWYRAGREIKTWAKFEFGVWRLNWCPYLYSFVIKRFVGEDGIQMPKWGIEVRWLGIWIGHFTWFCSTWKSTNFFLSSTRFLEAYTTNFHFHWLSCSVMYSQITAQASLWIKC